MDFDKYLKVIDLQEKYIELFPDDSELPIEYIEIDNLDLKIKILTECIENKTRLYDNQTMIDLKKFSIESKLDAAIEFGRCK